MNGEWDEQGRRRGRSSVDQASVPVSATIAIVSGMLAGVVGTAVHGNIARFGDGVWIPWGAPLALALLLSLSPKFGALVGTVPPGVLGGADAVCRVVVSVPPRAVEVPRSRGRGFGESSQFCEVGRFVAGGDGPGNRLGGTGSVAHVSISGRWCAV